MMKIFKAQVQKGYEMEDAILIRCVTTDGTRLVIEYCEPLFKVIYNDGIPLIYRVDEFYKSSMVEVISQASAEELEEFLKAKAEGLKTMGFTKFAFEEGVAYSPCLFGQK